MNGMKLGWRVTHLKLHPIVIPSQVININGMILYDLRKGDSQYGQWTYNSCPKPSVTSCHFSYQFDL